ncbi:MAG TPA: GNAT family N-acetyltransferase [Gemmataceae bacterium]|jgi:GNAT superfamily N-acetyltransferase|nr:GNAT family N-acetyltransferase [Gemmataceae bacterium]
MTVRPIAPDELPAVRELFREYAAGLGVDLCFQGFEQELAALPGDFAPPAGRLLLAWDGDRPAGCVALRPLGAGTAELKRLYARPAFRGRGLGRQLVEAALAEAAAAGHHRVVLHTLPSMAAAVRVYRALGFAEVDPFDPDPVPGALYLGREL